jgi:FkbM family methyltransferase
VRTFPLEPTHGDLSALAQRRRLEECIEARGWTPAGIFEDRARGARSESRALRTLLSELHQLDKLVVVSLDRLVRSTQRAVKVLDRLRQAEVDLVSLDEGLDTSAETGKTVGRVLESLGRREPPLRWRQASGWGGAFLRSGFDPRTVIDVGVAAGTPALYEAFPAAYLVLIEPLREFEDDLRALTSQRRGEYVLTAVGNREGTAAMNINPDLLMSSLLERPTASVPLQQREVPITTLDELSRRQGWKPPFGLKLDVEGYEHQVLEGAARLLADTQFVIAELSVTVRFEGAFECAQVIDLMRSYGFRAADVLDAGKSSLGTRVDVLFTSR